MIQFSNVTKSFEKQTILKRIDKNGREKIKRNIYNK